MSDKQFVIFKLSNQNYSVNINKVQEIILFKDTIGLPNTPNFVEGIINLRGDVVCVVNLANRLGKKTLKDKHSQKIILTSKNGLNVGYLVDEVLGIMSVEDDKISPPPPIILNKDIEYVSGVINKDDDITLILDVDRILNTYEISQLVDMVSE